MAATWRVDSYLWCAIHSFVSLSLAVMMKLFRQQWWKFLGLGILGYVVVYGFLVDVPRLHILNETVRNSFFHIPMWFVMLFLFIASMVYSVRFLNKGKLDDDYMAVEFANLGLFFGILGVVTGMIWARFTWGEFWSGDPKQNGTAIGLLIYLAYMILRSAIEDEQKRARVSSVYNIFAFSMLIPLMYILPRFTDSLHPGSGGNQGFAMIDFDNKLRMLLYPAIIGWTLIGFWMASLRIRFRFLQKVED
jgi:heme exporter protein C